VSRAQSLFRVTLSTKVFGFLKRKKKVAEPKDPLAVYDGFIESLERQGAEVRKSAATLLALRGDLTRDAQKYEARGKELEKRVRQAEAKAISARREPCGAISKRPTRCASNREGARRGQRRRAAAARGAGTSPAAQLSSSPSARAPGPGGDRSGGERGASPAGRAVRQGDGARRRPRRGRAGPALADVYREDEDKKRLPPISEG